jgi:DNA-binding PadR family transcriptional regulator
LQRNGGRGKGSHKACLSWVPITTDFETVDAGGAVRVLHDVPAQSCVECGRIRISPDDVLRAEQVESAQKEGVTALESNVLLYVYADVPVVTKGARELREKYRLNKMLFYQWAELSKIGLGQSRIHDNFLNDVRGPVPEHLDDTCKSLEAKGLLDVQWGGRVAKRPYIYRLTPKGEKAAKALWNMTPEPVRESITKSKTELYLLDRFAIRDKVHAEYPQFKKSFTEA